MKNSTLRVLAIFAHPDDETLLAGGLLAKLASAGHEVGVLCLAPGNDDRSSRLRQACNALGVSSVDSLRYQEGMMWPDESGSRSSTNSQASDEIENLGPSLATSPVSDVASRIAGRMSAFSPDAVITHSPYGDYGHADHAMTHKATLKAFDSAAPERARLYSLAWPSRLVKLNSRLMKIGGRDIRRMGPNGRFNLSLAIQSNVGISSTLTIKVGDMLGTRRDASRFYSQELVDGPLPLRILEKLPLKIQRLFLGK